MHTRTLPDFFVSKTDLLSHDAFCTSNDLFPTSRFRVSRLQALR
jgi:hypothetical protein